MKRQCRDRISLPYSITPDYRGLYEKSSFHEILETHGRASLWDKLMGYSGMRESGMIDAVVDRLDLSELIEQFRGGGASAYHPSTLLKIWLFGWCRKVYTSPPLAAAFTRDVEFMWLAGEQRPSFVTLAVKKQLRRGKEKIEARHRYQDQLGQLDGRNSMGKSDPESNAMMMKDNVTIRPSVCIQMAWFLWAAIGVRVYKRGSTTQNRVAFARAIVSP